MSGKNKDELAGKLFEHLKEKCRKLSGCSRNLVINYSSDDEDAYVIEKWCIIKFTSGNLQLPAEGPVYWGVAANRRFFNSHDHV